MEKEKSKQKETTGAGLPNIFDSGPVSGGTITVSVGPYVERLPAAGRTVAEIRARFGQRFDIDERSEAIINGQSVSADTVIHEGQTLMFIHKAGEKG